MTDSQHDAHDAGPDFLTYLYVFVALSVCTVLSFVFYGVLGQGMSSASIIMLIAVIKALLVALIFMHLKFDWNRVYFLIIPALILGVMMMVVLLPDIVMAWHE
jgi:cytochrome c oxidase subunit 4